MAATGGTIRVQGLKELTRDFKKMDKALSKEVRGELKEAGELVRVEAASRFAGYDAGSAAGYKTRVRSAGFVSVEQSRRRVTGKRGDYGSLQMRKALGPALDDKSDDVVKKLDQMLGRLAGENGF